MSAMIFGKVIRPMGFREIYSKALINSRGSLLAKLNRTQLTEAS